MIKELRHEVPAGGFFVLLGLLLIAGMVCTPEPTQVKLVPNQPPTTEITGAPLDSSSAFHRYHVFWYGADPDGEVVEYGVAVSDSNIAPEFSDYRRTVRTDTIIDFTANNDVVLGHGLWVYAIDNEGQRDETPDRVYFNAVDVNRPLPVILSAKKISPDADTTDLALNEAVSSEGWCVRFTWTATDADLGGAILSYRIKLSTETSFSEIPADSTAVTYCDMRSGLYDFVVEAVDNAGAESLEPARWSWEINKQPDTQITHVFVDGVEMPESEWSGGQVEAADCAWPASVPTIPDSSRVTIEFTGEDPDGEVVGYSHKVDRVDILRCSRRRSPFTGIADSTTISLPVPDPALPDFFTSNDYEVFIRSHDDEGKPDATPASLKFKVNFPPVLRPSGLFPMEGDVLQAGSDSLLVVRFVADDVESSPLNHTYRTVLDNGYGLFVGPFAAESELYQEWPFPAVGEHILRYEVRDPGRRSDTLTVHFTVSP